MSRCKGPGAGVAALQRFWMKHQEAALAPQQELPAGFAVLCKQGWQLVLYIPSCSPLHSHLIWKRYWVSAASSHQGYRLLGCVFISKAAAEDPAQGQSAIFSTAWLCLLALQQIPAAGDCWTWDANNKAMKFLGKLIWKWLTAVQQVPRFISSFWLIRKGKYFNFEDTVINLKSWS